MGGSTYLRCTRTSPPATPKKLTIQSDTQNLGAPSSPPPPHVLTPRSRPRLPALSPLPPPLPVNNNPKKIPRAVLDGGIFDGCSFYAADLTGCSLKNTSLRRCNLSRARLGGLDLGALPALRPFGSCCAGAPGDGGAATAAAKKAREEMMIGRVEVSADGTVLAVLSGDGWSGKVRVWCVGKVFVLDGR